MDKDRWSAVVAALLALVLYVALPLLANEAGVMNFKNFEAARAFLFLTAGVLGFQILVTTTAKNSFAFSEHGFELSLTAMAGVLTLVGLAILKRNPLNAHHVLGLVTVLLFFALTLTIGTGRRTPAGTLHPLLRAVNYVLGAFAFETYVFFMLDQEAP